MNLKKSSLRLVCFGFASCWLVSCDADTSDGFISDFDIRKLPSFTEPFPAIDLTDFVISGRAFSEADNSITVLLNPLVDRNAPEVGLPFSSSGLTLTYNGSECTPDVSSVGDTNVNGDLVFILDTTGSVSWAIEGMKRGIATFLNGLTSIGVTPRVAGVEYGDEVRTSVDFTDVGPFLTWVNSLRPEGGGDLPENPLDAIDYAWDNFDFRPNALRMFINIADIGFHERDDGTDFAQTNLSELADKVKGQGIFSVIHADTAPDPAFGFELGVHPRYISEALGGFYVSLSGDLNSFDIAADTPIDEELSNVTVARCPAGTFDGTREIDVAYSGVGDDLRATIPIND